MRRSNPCLLGYFSWMVSGSLIRMYSLSSALEEKRMKTLLGLVVRVSRKVFASNNSSDVMHELHVLLLRVTQQAWITARFTTRNCNYWKRRLKCRYDVGVRSRCQLNSMASAMCISRLIGLATAAKISWKSVPCRCLKPLATRRALYLDSWWPCTYSESLTTS